MTRSWSSAVDVPASASVGTRSARPPLWLLALVALSGTLAMHVFIPALPQAGCDLGAASGTMQLSISFYIAGLAAGQLVYGPLADRFGRRPTLIGGMTLFAAASIAAAFAQDATTLVAIRLVQALGGCSGLVLGRTIVRDTSQPGEMTRRLALMNLMVGVGPSLAPLAGAALLTGFGWRGIFVALGAFGGCLLAVALWRLPETGPIDIGGERTTGRHYRALLRSRRFLAYSIGGGCASTSWYAFLGAAPFVFVDRFHQTSQVAASLVALIVLGLLTGSALASGLATRIPTNRLLGGASGFSLASAAIALALALAGHPTLPALLLLMFGYTLGTGTASPAALAEALAVDGRVIGSASGLYGFAQMAIGSLCTMLAGLGHDRAQSALLVMVGAGIVAQCCFRIAHRPART